MGSEVVETICAIATPPGEGGIGIVRVSGDKAVEVAARVVRLRSGQSLDGVEVRRLYRADLVSGEVSAGSQTVAGHGDALRGSGVLDEALVVVMRGPHSYTGEDVVEIHCHGGPLVLHLLCESLVRAGARVAEPGEFTKRAFLNGRLDLTQAEAVLDTITAKTESSLRIAQEQLRGGLAAECDRLGDTVIRMLAHVEAGIDFTEEDITFIDAEELAGVLREALGALTKLIGSCREGRIFREGIKAAIVGRPNVGKSSLLNALLDSDRAIVTPVPGTTRDVLEEVLNIRGVPVRLLDTAGLRASDDLVEQEGIKRSLAAIEQAELLIMVLDASLPLNEEDRELIRRGAGKSRVLVANKSDLPQGMEDAEVSRLAGTDGACPVVHISAKTGAGLDALRDQVRAIALRPGFEPGESVLVTKVRHVAALTRAKEALEHSLQSVTARESGEFVAMDLRAAADAFGEITGAVTTEDILDRIFREFCIGK